MSRIMVVEDNGSLARGLVALLHQHGYDADAVGSGQEAITFHATGVYEAIILDLGLPDISGFDVLQRLRAAHTHCPVLILTARSAVDDRVRGLDLGADDYLPKPFEPAELVARLRALLRRSHGDPSPRLAIGVLSWDRTSGAFYLADELLSLPRRERILLEQLMISAGKILVRERLVDLVFGLDDDVGMNALEVYVGRLRKRLGSEGPQIRTVRGLGYMLERS